MDVLIFGSGGREHALAWKLSHSALVETVWCAPGNPGMDKIGPCFEVDPSDLAAAERLTLQLSPDLVIIGPEAPLAAGLGDQLRARGFDVFGPGRDGARLESSKQFAKEVMRSAGIPTARAVTTDSVEAAISALSGFGPPYVLKADGLAAGKGVVISATREDAEAELTAMLGGRHGEASQTVLIEEFMEGEEASLFAVTDGEAFVTLPPAQDHKRLSDGDTGPNTGGMGAYCPAPVLTLALVQKAEKDIIAPLLGELKRRGISYHGVIYAGLMISGDRLRVVEFNCRFGDPECQALMMSLGGDLLPLLLTASTGGLAGAERELARMAGTDAARPAACVVLASPGYPEEAKTGTVLALPETPLEDAVIFQAGTKTDASGRLVSSGGRVLGCTAAADTLKAAVARAYALADGVTFEDAQFRRDIARRALD